MTFIEDIQELSRDHNEEVRLAQAHTGAFVTGLGVGHEVGEECFAGVPSEDDASYDEVLMGAAHDVVEVLRERGGASTHDYTEPGDVLAYGRGVKIGLSDAFDGRMGVAA